MPKHKEVKDIIFKNTVLIPEIIAEDAARDTIDKSRKYKDATIETKYNLVQEYIPKLVNRAEMVYANNQDFKKKLKAISGRDTLYMFMCRWTEALINNKPLNQ